ncbi:sensor histidine kinase [Acetobacterium wieringae]|uniref:histidine kinase n=1 Tax=Acetobacterium wieringae TaxID=52694 RepID=A0A1F2PFA7_9FIRM|nr:HAMP domain-containing sensor histidine kinase [Acetobacterium wieringae]OFV70049.1 alkaline phosphatase synthesis sensor protein PhoR [Acetobacterium wieringae]
MRSSIFSRLMLYLGAFFLVLCLLTYYVLGSYFEVYYTEKRTAVLIDKTSQAAAMYNQGGLTPELQAYIDVAEEEGIVIQIIKQQTVTEETSSGNVSPENGSIEIVAMRQALDGMDQSEGSGLTVVETKRLAAGGEHKGEGNEAGEGAGGGSGNGSGSGSGAGSGAEHGAGAGQQNSVENQVNAHQHEESFVIVLGSDEHQVEWLTHKIVANDGAQIIGRIPLYSVHEVIEIVENFLLVFLMIIFGCSLLFAYFFSRGISRPIISLNQLSREMGNLNFTKKYQGTRKDEIGQLGKTLNHISDELEEAILKLQEELNKERTFEKMRQRFTAQVSHEIQTPLAVIKSYAEALEDGILENREEEQEYFVTIQKEADKISGIASDLLDLAQIESGAYQLKKEAVFGGEVIASVVQRFVNTYPEKNIVFNNRCEPQQKLSIDRKRMEQVFYNLLNNAIKHVSPADGLIQVSCETQGNEWIVSVYNVGKSIPQNEINQIWEYFYKAQSDKKGTGLGLAIVKGIIICHGGKVAVDNRDKGVWFEVRLPL